MTAVNRALSAYIDRLTDDNQKLLVKTRLLAGSDDKTATNIRKAIHDASNILGVPEYDICDPDSKAIDWVVDVTHTIVALQVQVKNLTERLERK